MKLLKLRFFYFVCLLFALNTWAQDIVVKGQISDENGLPVPGASILVKGTNNSASSDIDGNYQVQASPAATLVISYIGYATQEIPVQNRTSIKASLVPAAQNLEEVVVVGYGTQKKSVVTGAISSIKASELANLPVNSVGQSLQGRASGVTVFANSGQPGSDATIRIRGVSSFNGNNSPLFVVDGIQTDNITSINQSDIESMEVLKDAASAAIYGTRAANGVVLITTKKGKSGKLTVNYSGFAGSSRPARKLDLLNATQYATLRNEQYTNGYSGGTFQLPFANPAALGKGTDWQDQIFNNNAQRSQHELSLSGGTEKSTFYMSFGLLDQNGIVSSDISGYNRKTIRLNSDHKVTKWLKVGQQATFTRERNIGIGNTNSEYGGPLASAINLDPTTPAIVTDPSTRPNPSDYAQQYAVKDANGNYYGISNQVGQEMTNPLAYASLRKGNYDHSDNIFGSVYAEVTPIEGLKVRTQATGKQAYYGSESFTPMSFLNSNNNITRNNLYRSSNTSFRWNVENTISYAKTLGGHNFSALVGQAAYVDNITQGQGITYFNQPVNTHAGSSFNWPTVPADITGSAYTNVENTLTSYFARATYDYKERYLFTGIIRRDGSSQFGANNKYGTFPAFSLGWNIAKESFWKENKIVNQLKIRGGYGVTGNDGLGRQFAYASLVGGGYNYTVGTGGNVTVGNTINYPSNPDIKWEETKMVNIGFDATLIQDLTLSAEWYNKKTDGILQGIQIPGYIGASGSPFGNVSSMKNTGVEIELAYRHDFGDFHFSMNGNFSTLKNTVTSVGADRKFTDGPSIQSSNFPLTRSQPGESYNAFYGFQTNGVFQNQAEINSYTNSAGQVIQPNAVPGDFKFKDRNGDGSITEADRTFLGKPLPDFSYGLTLNFDYKGVDLKLFGQGVGGNQIYQGLRRLDITNANWQTAALNRWTGEGTSNSYPRLSTTDPNGNYSKPSNFYLQDGDYFRIKIVQLGYSLPSDVIGKAGITKARIFVTGENLFTFTKYTGYDPEIGGDVMGIDRGYYPQARSFMVGCNLQF